MARLLTMAPSHFSEKARWALDRLSVPYEELCVAPGLHFSSLKRAGGRSAPTLVLDDGRAITDSTAILQHLDASAPAGSRLYPAEDALRAEVGRIEDELDEVFAFQVRSWMYSWALKDAALTRLVFVPKTTAGAHRLFTKLFLPVIRPAMRKRFKLDRKPVSEHFAELEQTWKKLDQRLAGKKYLVGDMFTAADLTLASLGAHAVAETGFGGQTIPLELRPPEERARTELLRATPTGQHIVRMYRELRRAKA